jgi:hypothetical protein
VSSSRRRRGCFAGNLEEFFKEMMIFLWMTQVAEASGMGISVGGLIGRIGQIGPIGHIGMRGVAALRCAAAA